MLEIYPLGGTREGIGCKDYKVPPHIITYMQCNLEDLCRGTDFPFQNIAFSISENLQFRFNMVEKWKFRFPIEIVHTKYWKFRLHRDVCYKYIRGSAEELHGNIFI